MRVVLLAVVSSFQEKKEEHDGPPVATKATEGVEGGGVTSTAS